MTDETNPVLTLDSYILIWATFQLIITFIVAFFVPEIDPELQKVLDASKLEKTNSIDKATGKMPSSPRRKSRGGKKNKKKSKSKLGIVRS